MALFYSGELTRYIIFCPICPVTGAGQAGREEESSSVHCLNSEGT